MDSTTNKLDKLINRLIVILITSMTVTTGVTLFLVNPLMLNLAVVTTASIFIILAVVDSY
jgi:hypothetical protein